MLAGSSSGLPFYYNPHQSLFKTLALLSTFSLEPGSSDLGSRFYSSLSNGLDTGAWQT